MRNLNTLLALAVTLVFFLSLSSSPLSAQSEQLDMSTSPVEASAQSDAIAPTAAEEPTKLAATDMDVVSPKVKPPEGSSLKTKSTKTTSSPATPLKAATNRTAPGKFALTFDDLKFDMEKSETFDRKLLTPEINGYHGGKVKIRGYIRPNFKQSGITKFIFVRDNKECCFGPQAAIFDNILVRLEKGGSTNYTVRPVTIEGDFVLKEYRGDDGNVWSLYRMYNAKIK